jgi:uncharacterized protein YdaU (DUF1376 family)
MAKEQSPAFQVYPREFEGDVNVKAMTLEEFGAYLRLLFTCWTEKGIPEDIGKLARILHVTKARMLKLWPALAPCFKSNGHGDLINPRLERERDKQRRNRLARSEAGKKGAASLHAKQR